MNIYGLYPISRSLPLKMVNIYTVSGPGLIDQRLRECPKRPNCVSSESNNPKTKIEPLELKSDPGKAWQDLKIALEHMGAEIQKDEDGYLWVTFTSKFFKFVDDVEFRLVVEEGIIHLRSASRVGYSDFGVNRKRIKRLREEFDKYQQMQ